MADYETLTLEREISCTPERLFHVIADRDLRQKWAAPNDESVVIIDEYDCRAVGREEIRCGPKDAPDFLSFTETLVVSGQMMSISLCSHEISKSDTGSTLRVKLQITSLVGADLFNDYRGGWSASLDNLTALASDLDLS